MAAGDFDFTTLIAGSVSLALIALFSLWAWKLWNGKWLRSISGNLHVDDWELDLPYQKRLGKETAALLLVGDGIIALVLCAILFDMSIVLLAPVLAFLVVVIVVGSVVVTFRANKRARSDRREAGKPSVGWPAGGKRLAKEDPSAETEERRFMVIQYVCLFAAGLTPAALFALVSAFGLTG